MIVESIKIYTVKGVRACSGYVYISTYIIIYIAMGNTVANVALQLHIYMDAAEL